MEKCTNTSVSLKTYVTSLKIRGTTEWGGKQTLLLNGLIDRDYAVIKDQCDNLLMSVTQ